MLVIQRKIGEAIRIGHEITVEVLDVWGQKVRLGIEAPRNVRLRREEAVHAEVERGGRDAAE